MNHPDFFTYDDTQFDLSHLGVLELSLTLQQHNTNPELELLLRIEFTNHCYTEGAAEGITEIDGITHHTVDHNGWPRWYDAERHTTSLLLPDFVKQIHKKKCQFAKDQNWLIIELEEDDGTIVPFYIVFSIWKHKWRENSLGLRVISAYKKTKGDNTRKRSGNMASVSFAMLARKTLAGEAIKSPRK